jgi:hypothetical protein
MTDEAAAKQQAQFASSGSRRIFVNPVQTPPEFALNSKPRLFIIEIASPIHYLMTGRAATWLTTSS